MLHIKADGMLPERLVLTRPGAIEQFSWEGFEYDPSVPTLTHPAEFPELTSSERLNSR